MSISHKSIAKLSKVGIEPPGSSENLDKEKSTELESGLEPVLEVTEVEPSEIFEIPIEFGEYDEIPPRIIDQKIIIDDYFSIEAQYNVIYELGIVNLCWPVIEDPVFEPRTCFPRSYYTNTKKERLLLAYAESFRRQYNLLFGKDAIPILLDAPNECGMPKMVCTTIRPTKLSYTGTNTWEGLASLVADYFEYEPLLKPMLHMALLKYNSMIDGVCYSELDMHPAQAKHKKSSSQREDKSSVAIGVLEKQVVYKTTITATTPISRPSMRSLRVNEKRNPVF